jgi:lipopolysaccharide transport system ATP-binding protein
MSGVALRARGLSKRYRIGASQARYKTFRESLTEAVTAPVQRAAAALAGAMGRGPRRVAEDEAHVWALADVSFTIAEGEVVGIVGRNGAGKSTLLKILSRITEPTAGEAAILGRVGSLLEVGTGFHPELTGRENIFLNGAILGMRHREIRRKFDEIVAFSEVEKFIDTPMKHYSTGMYMRLAFSVAAHLEPDILLVDEVLAVGDAAFQKKCLGKMGDVAREGRTVLFVSHQMNTIRKLCGRCLWLDGGKLRMDGPTVHVVSGYEAGLATVAADDARRIEGGNLPAQFLAWDIVEPRGDAPNVVTTTGPLTLRTTLRVSRPIRRGVHGIALYNSENQLMWAWAKYDLTLEPGRHELLYALPGLPLRPGVYWWHVSLSDEGTMLDLWHCVPEMIIATEPLGHPRDEWTGVLNVGCTLEVRREAREAGR